MSTRLEELARAAEQSGADADAIAKLLEAASVATMHAVALELLTAQARPSVREAPLPEPAVVDAPPLADAA